MNQKEVTELKKRFTKDSCTFPRVCGIYVDVNKNKQASMNMQFLNLDEDVMFKYLDIAKKTLSGKVGDALLNIDMHNGRSDQEEMIDLLLGIKDSKLGDEKLLDQFYDRVIESYITDDPYYIILFYDAYDVPEKASDEMELDDSEEVYTYILCSICPVKMSKPGLGYYETEDKVDLRIRDWVVQTPVAGFLYPSFNERSSDVNEALFFSKKPKEIDHCFIDDLMCCESGRSKSEKKVEFDSIVEKVLEEYLDAEEKIYSFHENLNALVDEREATESDEPLTAEEVLDAAQEAGFEEAYAQQISDSYASSFKEDPDTPETFVDKKLLEKNAALKEVTDLKAEVSRLMKENLELKKRLEE